MKLYAEWSKVEQPPQLGDVVWVRDLRMRDVQGVIIEIDPIEEIEEVDRERFLPTGRWLYAGFTVTVCAAGCGEAPTDDLYVQTRFTEDMRQAPKGVIQ